MNNDSLVMNDYRMVMACCTMLSEK